MRCIILIHALWTIHALVATSFPSLVPNAEKPVGMSLGKFRLKHPRFMSMVETQPEVTLPADPRNGLEEPVNLKILSPIEAGEFGIVVKANANGKEIAFKILVPSDWEDKEEQEIILMSYLHDEGVVEVLKPELGVKVHFFDVGENEYRGFGMELFEHPTLLTYFRSIGSKTPDCILGAVRCFAKVFGGMKDRDIQMAPGYRAIMLESTPVKTMYNICVGIFMKMWKLGVIHNDLHVSNILYDEQQERLRVIDFGLATMPDRGQQKKFFLGVMLDFMRFTFSFVTAVLYPETYGKDGQEESRNWDLIKRSAFQISPIVIQIIGGNIPSTPEWMEIYSNFWDRNGITREAVELPKPDRIKQAVKKGMLSWESADSISLRSDQPGPSNYQDYNRYEGFYDKVAVDQEISPDLMPYIHKAFWFLSMLSICLFAFCLRQEIYVQQQENIFHPHLLSSEDI